MRSALVALALSALAPITRPLAADLPFSDDFETGNLFRWAEQVGEILPTPTVFRQDLLALRDPHLFVDLGFPFGCFDFTDDDIPLVPGTAVNAGIAASLVADDEPDGVLDSSPLLLFRPLATVIADARLDRQDGLCSAPAPPASCAPDSTSLPQTFAYDALAAGLCAAPLGGTTTAVYTPDPPSPGAPCFATAPRTFGFDLSGLIVAFSQVVYAGELVDDPVTGIARGLLAGFLSETDADAILLPEDLLLVGGEPLSSLLPGGSLNCAAHDDRDELAGVNGWWFYFEFAASPVDWSGE